MTGLELKIERIRRGIKQFELSLQTGIRAPRLSVIENGRETPKPEELEAICRALKIDESSACSSVQQAS